MESLRGKVAIVGATDTEVGVVPHLSATQLYVKGAKLALEDAGITKEDVDGLITCTSWVEPYMYHAEMIAEYMQIFPRYCLNVATGGGTTLAIMHHAASAIATGVCNTVLITMADNMLSGLSRDKAVEAIPRATRSSNVLMVRRFLGFMRYWRRPICTNMARPVNSWPPSPSPAANTPR